MTWGVTIDVSAPVEVYDAVHAAVLERIGTAVDGLLLHLARPTEGGFQVIDVWNSREDSDRYYRDAVMPLIAEMSGGRAPEVAITEFEVRGLVLPRAGVAV